MRMMVKVGKSFSAEMSDELSNSTFMMKFLSIL